MSSEASLIQLEDDRVNRAATELSAAAETLKRISADLERGADEELLQRVLAADQMIGAAYCRLLGIRVAGE